MPRGARKSGSSANNDSDYDREKSLEDWEKLTTEALKLKCNQYSLVSAGKKKQLKTRLFEHFQNNEFVNNQIENLLVGNETIDNNQAQLV